MIPHKLLPIAIKVLDVLLALLLCVLLSNGLSTRDRNLERLIISLQKCSCGRAVHRLPLSWEATAALVTLFSINRRRRRRLSPHCQKMAVQLSHRATQYFGHPHIRRQLCKLN
jgi:hypothetical protein